MSAPYFFPTTTEVPVLIKCNCIRQGGTKVDIDDKHYHFAPNANGDHVCTVVDKEHIKRFMSIDAYEAYETEPLVVAANTTPAPPVGKQVGEVSPPAPPAGADATDTNKTPPAPPVAENPPPSAPNAPANVADTYDAMGREALAAEVQRRTGKPPHHKTSEANLRIALRELDSAA